MNMKIEEQTGAGVSQATQVLRRRRRKRLIGWSVTLALVLMAAAFLVFHLHSGNAKPSYTLAPVTRGDIEKSVTALGSVKPKDYVDVGVQVSGQIQKILVNIGDRVKKGELLAEIDPKVYQTRVDTDRANMASLRAQLQQQKAQLVLARQQGQRNHNLYKQHAVSLDTVQTSDAAIKVDQAQIESYQAQIAAAQSQLNGDIANLGYTKIYAPMAGTVTSAPAVVGQTLNANQTTPTVLEIADLDTMTVWAQVAEADIPKLKVGMPVYFTTLGTPDKRWHSSVRQILPTPETVNDVVLYDVLVDIANPDHSLMSSMTAQVFFVLGQAKQVPLVPVAALHHRKGAQAGQDFVLVKTDQGLRSRQVSLGLQNRTEAQIRSGLQPGDQVVTSQLQPRTAGESGRRHFGFGPHL